MYSKDPKIPIDADQHIPDQPETGEAALDDDPAQDAPTDPGSNNPPPPKDPH